MPTPKSAAQQVTPLEEWGQVDSKEEGFLVTLPVSGKTVRMRRSMDMMSMLRGGLIPNPLAKIVREMMATGNPDVPQAELTEEVLNQMMDMTSRTVLKCVIEPKVSMPEPKRDSESPEEYEERVLAWQPPSGHLSISLIPLEDRQYIEAVAQGRAADLEPFRAEQKPAVAAVPEGGEVGAAPKQPPRAVRRKSAKSGG